MEKYLCYFNDGFILETQAYLQVSDLGLLRGYGVFDFLRTYNGKPFLLKEHLDRLENSAFLMGLQLPFSKDKIAKIIKKLVNNNNKTESTVRVLITGGPSVDGFTPSEKPTFIITSRHLKPLDQDMYRNGVKLITDEHLRHLPQAKHLDYTNLIKNRTRIKEEGAFNLLYTYQGKVLEVAISNIFIIKKCKLITPSKNILIGTIRNLIIKLVSNKYAVKEQDISIDELFDADEIFITGTTQGVVPVVKINDEKISNMPGIITKEILNIFNDYICH